MATPTTWPSAKAFVNWSKETTQGTPVITSPWTYPLSAPLTVKDNPVYIVDPGMRGSMVDEYGMVQGVSSVSFSMQGWCFFDGVGFLINNILGDITTTGASAPFSHAMAVLNSGTAQPGSLTLVDWQGTPTTFFARQIPGACLSQLVLKGNAESSVIEFTATGIGWPSSDLGSAPTAAPTAALGQAAWRTALGLAGPATGGTQVKTAREWSITITRKLRAEWTLQNLQTPFIVQRGAVQAAGTLLVPVPADETVLNYYLANTQPQIQLIVNNGLTLGSALVLQIDAALAAFNSAEIVRNEEAIGYNTAFKCIANSTNAGASGGVSPLKVTLQNALPAGTY